MSAEIGKRLLAWYQVHARNLPWRGTVTPYTTLVSEIMLQQTRVDTVLPYYERWMKRFPDLKTLAQADEQAVLQMWEGLGYYRRAHNLHKAAQLILKEHGGQIPSNRAALEKLPGIGRYTAAAIASIAFQQDEAALDGNIRRVLSRVFNVQQPTGSPQSERLLWKLAQQNLPAGRAGDYNQAWMDLGALICTPREPVCESCPLAVFCQARILGLQEKLPVSRPKNAVPHITVTAAVIQQEGKTLIARRPPNGLLGGLWEFPGGKLQENEDLNTCLAREIREELDVDIRVGQAFGVYRHAYTHFRVTLHAFCCQLLGGTPRAVEASELRWIAPQELTAYPMGKIDRQIALRLLEKNACPVDKL